MDCVGSVTEAEANVWRLKVLAADIEAAVADVRRATANAAGLPIFLSDWRSANLKIGD